MNMYYNFGPSLYYWFYANYPQRPHIYIPHKLELWTNKASACIPWQELETTQTFKHRLLHYA